LALLSSTGFEGFIIIARSLSLVHRYAEAGGGQLAQDETDVAGYVLGHFNSP
jgi:hypothetical protein